MPRIIGTKHETSLHRALKSSYAGYGGQTEVEFAGFVADGINAQGECFEIQTGHFGSFMNKAKKLASLGSLKVVYPVVVAKYLEVFDAEGRQLCRKKSTRVGSIWDILGELVYAPELPLVQGLEIELALVDVAEQRIHDGKGSWRRKGVSIGDRRLLDLHDKICLKTPADYLRFVPFSKSEDFTSETFGKKARIRVGLARKSLYVLAKLGIVEKTGKKGNMLVYRLLIGPRTRKWKKPPAKK